MSGHRRIIIDCRVTDESDAVVFDVAAEAARVVRGRLDVTECILVALTEQGRDAQMAEVVYRSADREAELLPAEPGPIPCQHPQASRIEAARMGSPGAWTCGICGAEGEVG